MKIKKKLSAFFLSGLFLCAASWHTEGQAALLGKEVINQGKQSYERGDYKTFISELNAEFERAGKGGLLAGAFEKMKATTRSGKFAVPDQSQIRAHNQGLLEACANHPDLDVCQRIDNVVFFTLTDEQEKALSAVEGLRYKIPLGKKPSTLEEKLSIIETEFYMKSTLLEIAFEKSKPDFESRIKKQEALALEKFARMAKTAAQDPVWRERVSLACSATEARLAHQFDWQVLKDLSSGKLSPPTPADAELVQMLREVK